MIALINGGRQVMKVKWLGHACFLVEEADYIIALDPYGDDIVPGLRPLTIEANQVLTSHDHSDHNAISAVQLEPCDASPFTIARVESAHDDQDGTLRGKNTIHFLEASGVRVAHLEDVGENLTDAQAVKIGEIDALLIPIGGHYTINAKQAFEIVRQLAPTVIIPMHYRTDRFGYDVIGPLSDFTKLFEDEEVRMLPGDTITITEDMPRQVAVLQYK